MLETAREEASAAREEEASAARAETRLPTKAMLASVRADARAAREEVHVAREEVRVAREEARVSSKAEAVATGSVMELRTLTAELQCKLEAATEAQLNWENHKLQERGAELLAPSNSQAEELKAMLATASKARVSIEAELAATGSQVEELKAMLATAREEAHVSRRQMALASAEAGELEKMLATAREVARTSAEAEVAVTGSKVGELKALLATSREEAREARQVAHRAASEGACTSAEAEVALTELRALASEMECKLEAAYEVEHRRTATEAHLCRENQQLHARVATLLTELEAKPEVAKPEVAPAVDLVLDELNQKPKTMQPNVGHPPSEPASPARTKPAASTSPTLPAHLRPVNLNILEQQARLMTQSSDNQESAKVNERLELARLHNRHVAKMGPAATKLAWLARGHLTRARLQREREAARVAEHQRETEIAWAKTLSRPAPNGRRGKLTRRQHVLEREAVAAYFNLQGLPPPNSEVARHARELAEAVKAHRAVIDARNEGILQGRVLVVDPRVVREERLREEKLCKLRRAGFYSVDTQAHAPASRVEGSVEELAEGGRNEEADEEEEEEEEEDGWERVLDQTTGREYFWHNVTDEVRWTEPPEMAAVSLAAAQ